MDPVVIELADLQATERLANSLAEWIDFPLCIALEGSLGTGKTQLVRFMAARWGVHPEEVTSPTYVLLQRYVGSHLIYHFDFYRLDSAEQVWDLGIDELYEQPVVILIEWADKFPECLPDDLLRIRLQQGEDSARTATLSAMGSKATDVLKRLRN